MNIRTRFYRTILLDFGQINDHAIIENSDIGTLHPDIGQCIFPRNIFSDFATTCPFLIGQYSHSLDNNQFYWTLSQKFTAKLLPRIGYWTIFQLYWTFFKIYWNIFAIYWTFFKIYWTILFLPLISKIFSGI